MILPEERILQPQDPVPEDQNDWPEFTLTDVKVRVAERLKYTSLLEARVDYPLTITGRLLRLDSQRAKLVIYPKYTQVQIRIDECTQFAFGQDPSGKSVIWAAGKAGWFKIIPSVRYTPIYEDTLKAIDLIYFLSDAHHVFASRRPVRGAKINELLALYQQHTDYRVDDNAEAEAVLETHHSFLIRQMLEGWEGINWARTHLWSYFSTLYPDEVAQDTTAGSDEEDDESGSDESQQDDDPNCDGSSCHGSNKERTWPDTIFDEIMRLKASGHMCKRFCSVDEIAKFLVRHYNVPSKDEAGEIIKDAAGKLLLRLDADPDQGGNRAWRRKVVYRQLQRLVDSDQELQEDEDPDGIITPAKEPANRRHQKSILRPSTGAGKGKKRVLYVQSPTDEENEEEDLLADPIQYLPGAETPAKKRRFGSNSANFVGQPMTNGVAATLLNGSAPDLQQEQLDLIRKESIANGRLHINHLEALIEGLIGGH